MLTDRIPKPRPDVFRRHFLAEFITIPAWVALRTMR
jgi:hypothetical protein